MLNTVRIYLDAYARKDLAGIEALLADAVALRDWNGSATGKAAVLAETRKNFESAESIDIKVLALYASGSNGVAAELQIQVNGHIDLRVVDVFDLDAQARIVGVRAYKG